MILTSITNFLITEWIWSFTQGISHVSINFIILFMLLKLWDHMSWLKALLLSFFLSVGSFLFFFMLLTIVLVWGLGVTFVLPEDTYAGTYNILNTSLVLAALYSLLQIAGLSIAHKWIRFNLWRAYLCVISANAIAALLVYKITFNM